MQMLGDIFFGLIDMFMSFIPDININISGEIGAVASVFAYVDNVLPISTILTCIGLIIVVDNISFFVKIFNFIIRKIPGIS